MRRRRAFVWLAAVSGALAVGFGALWAAYPDGDVGGPSDPILALRRPVLALMRAAGLASRQGPESFELWLPVSGDGWEVEPVYRALFVRSGWRVARTVEAPTGEDVRSVRLVAERAGRAEVLDERFGSERTPSGGARWRVHGFVPADADGFHVDAVRADGSVVTSRGCTRSEGPPAASYRSALRRRSDP